MLSLWNELLARRLARVLLLALSLAGACAGAGAVEPSLIWPEHGNVAAEAWVDRSGTGSLEAARGAFDAGQGHPASTEESMPLGHGDAVWLRLHLPSVSVPTHAVFAVAYSGIDRVELYRPDGRGGWNRQVAGDSVPVIQWPVRYLYPAFAITVEPGESQPTFMRVQHAYPIALKWALWDARSFSESSKLWHLALGACLGLMLLVVVISIAHAISWRDPIHFYYAVHVVLVALGVMCLTGIAGEYLWPRDAWWNDLAAIAIPFAALGWMGVLVRELVAERGKKIVSTLLLAHIGICAAVVTAFLSVGRQVFFQWPNVYALASMLFIVGVLAWYSARRPQVGLWVLAGMGMLLVSAIFPVLRNLGLVPVTLATQYGPQLGGVFEVPLVLVGLYFRSRERRDNHLRMEALSHTDPLTGVANHRVLLEHLQRLVRRTQRAPTAGGVLRIHVQNLQAIRAEYGREAAEAAIVRAAECVTLEAAETDLVGREQGGDLVLLLDGRISRAQAAEAARNIIARGLKFSGRLPPGVTLALRIAGVCPPRGDEDASTVLATLGRVVQELAAEQGGRAIRILQTPGEPTQP